MLLLACNAASADEAAFMPEVMSFEPREQMLIPVAEKDEVELVEEVDDTTSANAEQSTTAPSSEDTDTDNLDIVATDQDTLINPDNQVMGWTGVFLLVALVTLSNAGGLSGGGVTIPIMLMFFDMEMKVAVPVSAFIAVSSTVLRFIINFNQRHPNNDNRLTINYDIVILTMPAVFCGSLIGV